MDDARETFATANLSGVVLTPEMDEPAPPSPWDRQEGGGHYKALAIQPGRYNIANGLGWAEGSVVHYVTRWREKGGVEDLRKAIHTLELLIAEEEAQ